MVRAVIFDMDGLIIDSELLQLRSYDAVLQEKEKERRNALFYLDGDLSLKILAPIYSEFQRWRELLKQEFQSHMAGRL